MNKASKKRLKYIIELRKQKISYQMIGDLLGISKQRVCQITHHDYNRSHKKSKLVGLEGRDLLREKVRIRDNYTCQICGKNWRRGQRRFDVHHLDPNKESKNGRVYSQNKDIDTMITLCHKCHLNLKSVKEKFRKGAKRYQLQLERNYLNKHGKPAT